MDNGVQAQNKKGNWVPAIPEPYYGWILKECCSCGDKFWTKKGYQAHYAVAHILEY